MAGRIVAAAALLIFAALPVAAQQTLQPLPDVSVTAPAPAPPMSKAFSPFSTHTRVEEDKWPVIPCIGGISRIEFGTGAKCQNGSPTETFMSAAGAQDFDTQCDISHQLMIADDGRYRVEADVLIFDPYKIVAGPATGHLDKNCTIWSGFRHLPDDFVDMNQVTRRATNWRNFVKDSDQNTMEFTDGTRNCAAVERFGPRWHGGNVWLVHAAICPDSPVQLTSADIDAVFGMMKLQVYDPVGNLASPPSTLRSAATR
jgi:hypothetical protein